MLHRDSLKLNSFSVRKRGHAKRSPLGWRSFFSKNRNSTQNAISKNRKASTPGIIIAVSSKINVHVTISGNDCIIATIFLFYEYLFVNAQKFKLFSHYFPTNQI